MNRSPDTRSTTAAFGILVGMKLTVLRNLVRQSVQDGPLKLAVSVTFLGLIWAGLYFLFNMIFDSFDDTPLEAAVVIPVIFNLFFLSLLVLLGFSNAVIAYGSLFGKDESAFLLSAPIPPAHLVLLKYLESLFFASWSLILLGLPLMMAIANYFEESATFYPLFVAFFLCFVPIPGALGLVLAWLAARFLPRRGDRALVILGAVLLGIAALWAIRAVRHVEVMTSEWTARFFASMEFAQAALLPSTWVARGIEHALHGRYDQSLLYLAVTLSNAMFASMVAVGLCGRSFLRTFDRASSGSGKRRSAGGRFAPSGGACSLVFFYLPQRLRLIATKDLRNFLRDPLQWSQLVILFGLMGLYLLNMPRFYTEMADSRWGLLLPFLNLCAVSLMLATFTSRFVFPLPSLEGHQMWLLGLVPLRRGRILLAKFAYAATVTIPLAAAATLFAAASLKLDWGWTALHLAATVTVCVGLCGLSVGLGARLPTFGQRNAGRIANGFGGTVNLITSVTLVVLILAGMALATIRADRLNLNAPDLGVVAIVLATVLVGFGTGATALYIGARHFNRLEV